MAIKGVSTLFSKNALLGTTSVMFWVLTRGAELMDDDKEEVLVVEVNDEAAGARATDSMTTALVC